MTTGTEPDMKPLLSDNPRDEVGLLQEDYPGAPAFSPLRHVAVVSEGSTDETVAVARQLRPDARIVLETRWGKGNALAEASRHAPVTSSW
jgi:hypothetical protein